MSFLTERYFQILEDHRLYTSLDSREAFALFAEFHVICAWSYNAILRSLQRDIFALSLPLNSDPHKEAIRILSEITIEEETGEIESGRLSSHLELYLEAMTELGANTAPILAFFDIMAGGIPMNKAVEYADFYPETAVYANEIVRILGLPLHQRAAALFYEGEYFIPDRFLYHLQRQPTSSQVHLLLEYFEGHIEGLKKPGYSAAGRLVEILNDNEESLCLEAEQIGEQIMRFRIYLWNAIAKAAELLPPKKLSVVRPAARLVLVT